MRKNRLFMTVAALGMAASITAIATPAMASPAIAASAASTLVWAAEHGSPSALQDMANPDYNFSCPSGDYFSGSPKTYTVKTTGIHIRMDPSPSGTVLYSIADGEGFRSSWSYETFTFRCVSKPVDGQTWVLGWDVANHTHTGWIGSNYLN